MKNKFITLALSAMLFALCVPAQAQQPTKVPQIGYLVGASFASNAARIEAFRHGLRELSYVEGKNIVIDWRTADGKPDRLPALTAELVRLKVDVIVTGGPTVTRAAKEATSTIPIVMTNDPDPVGDGFIANLARPGGNITGLSTLSVELSGKRLEILTEVVPKLSRVAILGTSSSPGNVQMSKEIEIAAKAFGVTFQDIDVLDSKDIETAFRAAVNGRAQSVLTLSSPILDSQRAQIVEVAAKNRLPAIYHRSEFVEDGGLCFTA
jgi:putative ABC transport system substrate-binding protein